MPYLNQRVGKVIPKSNYLKAFIFSMFRLKSFRKKIENLSHGSAQPNISSLDILKIKYVHPPENLIKFFSDMVLPNIDKILLNYEENSILIEIREMLISKLVSGKFKIDDSGKIVENIIT